MERIVEPEFSIDDRPEADGAAMGIRVMIVDDHSVVRQGLKMFLKLDTEIEVVGEAKNGREAIEQAKLLRPDVVLMDLLMPVMGGIETIARIRADMPGTEVIAMTSVMEDSAVVGAVRAGAIGYLLKDTDGDALCKAIRAAAVGQVQLAPAAAARLIGEIRAPRANATSDDQPLTEREADVLRLLAQGQSNKEIASELGIGEKTVKTHVSNVLAKLGVQSRTQAALQAVRLGLIQVNEVGGRA